MTMWRSFGILTVSCIFAAYIFYILVPVPGEIEQSDDVYWLFFKRKVSRALSILGERLGFGHRIHLYRFFSSCSLLSSSITANYSAIKPIVSTKFDGIPVRLYTPVNMVNKSPGLIWLHGGGWTLGSAESDDFLATELARTLGVMIVSVNYRLAPEHPYPAPFDDCFRATVYFLDHASEMGVDPSRIAIGGASAGGNLAAAVSLKLRDVHHVRQPSIQVLLVPCLQAIDFNTPSYQREADNTFLPRYWMASYWLWYARGFHDSELVDVLSKNGHTSPDFKTSSVAQRTDHQLLQQKYFHPSYIPNAVNYGDKSVWNELEPVLLDPYFSPLLAGNLSNLPPAYIATADFDILRDDGIMYARRLTNDGVAVEHRNYERGYHAMFGDYSRFRLAKTVFNDLITFLLMQL